MLQVLVASLPRWSILVGASRRRHELDLVTPALERPKQFGRFRPGFDHALRAGVGEQLAQTVVEVTAGGEGPHAHTRGEAGRHAVHAVLNDEAVARVHTDGPGSVEKEVGRRLGVCDVIGAVNVRREEIEESCLLQLSLEPFIRAPELATAFVRGQASTASRAPLTSVSRLLTSM